MINGEKRIKMVKLLLISILAFANNDYAGDSVNTFFKTQLPRLEIEGNVGIYWIIQAKGNFNINDNFYCKIRSSSSFLSSDYGLILGYQIPPIARNRVQIGLGYSKGEISPFVPAGPDEGDTTEHWNGAILETNFIHYFNSNFVRIGFNIGINFIFAIKKTILLRQLNMVNLRTLLNDV
jgi:hypothetical protein